MFYANCLFAYGLAMVILSDYGYGITALVAGIIIMLIGAVAGLKVEFDTHTEKTLNDEKFKELKNLVETQTK